MSAPSLRTLAAGDLREQVAIRAVTRTGIEGGGWTEAEGTVATVWARVEPLQGRELSQFMQAGMAAPIRFTIRYQTGIAGATRILWSGRTFNVTSVTDTDARHVELVILADEVK